MKEADIIDRLKAVMDELGHSPASFCSSTGISRPVLSHILNGRNKPSIQFLLQISNAFPEVSLDWLITGRTQALPTPPAKQDEHANDRANLDNEKTIPLKSEEKSASESEETILRNKESIPTSQEPIELNNDQKDESKVQDRIIIIENGKYEIIYPKHQ